MKLDSLRQVIQDRRTLKVLADPESPWEAPDPAVRDRLAELLQAASHAPFHYPADQSHRTEPLTSPVPWRFHVLDGEACRRLLERLLSEDIESGKIANMLAAADALVLATWLPDPQEPALAFQEFAPTLRNMEHIAAASAAVQNLLLLATAVGSNNYWSSGGVLRSERVYDWAGIDPKQIMLGAVFLFPQDTGTADAKPGANRGRQGPAPSWLRWADLKQPAG
ncbi:MAG: nitroreductase family protein [Planctomycetota bacterium]